MPNGDSTVIVGELVKMKSQVYPILKVTGEINQFGIGDVRTYGGRGRHFRKSELSEDRMRYGDMTSRRHAHLRSSAGKDFVRLCD
ncbi:hypothetical protein Acr_27g0009860 [Actinidia rufa]|uniref:Uncharacterized protein n=1 Tax=Actinidia rufa TaxID=165716 RepID=A0A7J0H807_9ERIC|nr:hypothetical protein Acr_27g0009860 [Actinidia rufa]